MGSEIYKILKEIQAKGSKPNENNWMKKKKEKKKKPNEKYRERQTKEKEKEKLKQDGLANGFFWSTPLSFGGPPIIFPHFLFLFTFFFLF